MKLAPVGILERRHILDANDCRTPLINPVKHDAIHVVLVLRPAPVDEGEVGAGWGCVQESQLTLS
jgi:hypothetical protein